MLAAWTLIIKYAFPMAWALNEGAPLLRYVWWDFWWVAHIWLGLALIEAMAAGVPSVSTRCPHGPDEIIEDGTSGLLVDVGDTVNLRMLA